MMIFLKWLLEDEKNYIALSTPFIEQPKSSRPCPIVPRVSSQIQKPVLAAWWRSNRGRVVVLLKTNRPQTNKRLLGGKGESPRTMVGRDGLEPKTMVSILFRRSGVDQITYWDREATITSESYIEDCLKPLVRTIKKQRPTLGAKMLKFHQDNARPHVARSVITFGNVHKI